MTKRIFLATSRLKRPRKKADPGPFNPAGIAAALEGAVQVGMILNPLYYTRIILPWPPAALNPNARDLWAKIRAGKAYRKACWAETIAQFGSAGYFLPGPLRLRLDFFPPTDARRDDDNIEAAFKAGRDGVAAALRVDDSHFRMIWRELHLPGPGVPKVPGGAVLLTLLADRRHPDAATTPQIRIA